MKKLTFGKAIAITLMPALALIGVLISCSAGKKSVELSDKIEPEINIIEATRQKFSGGMKGSPGGTHYKIMLIAPGAENEFQVNAIIADGYLMPAGCHKANSLPGRASFLKGDTLLVKSAWGPEQNLVTMPDASKRALEYHFKTKKFSISLPLFKNLPEERRP